MVTATRDESVVDAARRMAELGVGDLIVVDDRGGAVHPVGIVTDRDLVVKFLTRSDCAPGATTLGEVMRADLVTASEEDDVETVLATLRRHGIRRVPIVDRHGALQGIISLDDLVGWMSEQLHVAVALIERQGSGVPAS